MNKISINVIYEIIIIHEIIVPMSNLRITVLQQETSLRK